MLEDTQGEIEGAFASVLDYLKSVPFLTVVLLAILAFFVFRLVRSCLMVLVVGGVLGFVAVYWLGVKVDWWDGGQVADWLKSIDVFNRP